MNVSENLDLRPGDWVEVRSAAEILATLDDTGALGGLLFMPEMLAHCGRRYQVFKRADRTCDATGSGDGLFRRMEATVHLSMLRCNGSGHGGCQAGCLMYWKEAWLRKTAGEDGREEIEDGLAHELNGASLSPRDHDWLAAHTRKESSPDKTRYRCQATEVSKASCPLAFWEPKQYVRDVCTNDVPVSSVARTIWITILSKIVQRLTGKPFPNVLGSLTRTPVEDLGLQPGDWVTVKSKEEILATLDTNGRNRGMTFESEMLPYCGKRFRVLRRVERIIEEKSGRMLEMRNASVILENVICASRYRRACPRSNYLYWREIWLERAAPDPTFDRPDTEVLTAAALAGPAR